MPPEHIREARLDAGLTQAELAARLDVRQQSVQAWESGKALPSTEKLIHLAEILHVSTDQLLGRPGVHVDSANVDLEKLHRLDPEQYKVIVAQLRLAADRAIDRQG